MFGYTAQVIPWNCPSGRLLMPAKGCSQPLELGQGPRPLQSLVGPLDRGSWTAPEAQPWVISAPSQGRSPGLLGPPMASNKAVGVGES